MLHIRTQTHTRRTANTILLAIITIVVGSVGCLGAFFHKVEAFSQVFTVTTTSDSGAGSLRQAILDSNAAPSTQSSPNEIVFDIANADPDKTAVQTISLQNALPQITQPLVIDGTTQQGAQCGTLVPTDANGVIQPNNTEHTLMVEVTGVNTAGLTNIFSIADSAAGSGLRASSSMVQPTRVLTILFHAHQVRRSAARMLARKLTAQLLLHAPILLVRVLGSMVLQKTHTSLTRSSVVRAA